MTNFIKILRQECDNLGIKLGNRQPYELTAEEYACLPDFIRFQLPARVHEDGDPVPEIDGRGRMYRPK